MAGKVFPLIETGSNPLSVTGSIFSNDTYIEEEGIPEPDDSEIRLTWSRKYYRED
jgi:hypothetical protein